MKNNINYLNIIIIKIIQYNIINYHYEAIRNNNPIRVR